MGASPSKSFYNYIPQLAVYGLSLKKLTGIKNLHIIALNNEKACQFDPEILGQIDAFMGLMNPTKDLGWQDLGLGY